jgi:lipopolysaccharide transport system permease protein
VLALYRRRELIWVLTVDELKRRYAGSLLGGVWVVLKPVLLLGLYVFLFGIIFQPKAGKADGTTAYPLLVLTGLVPWLMFAESLTASASAITAHTGLATKLLFPIEVLPISRVLAVTMTGLITIVLLLGLLSILHGLGPAIALLPLMLLAQTAFTLGLAWGIAVISVRARDLSEALPFLLSVWMFLSPVVYTRDMLPAAFAALLEWNPMTYLLEAYRAILLERKMPPVETTFLCFSMAAAVFLGGLLLFRMQKARLMDLL